MMFVFLYDWAIILLSLLYIHYGTSIIHIKINMSTSFLEFSRKKEYVREGERVVPPEFPISFGWHFYRNKI